MDKTRRAKPKISLSAACIASMQEAKTAANTKDLKVKGAAKENVPTELPLFQFGKRRTLQQAFPEVNMPRASLRSRDGSIIESRVRQSTLTKGKSLRPSNADNRKPEVRRRARSRRLVAREQDTCMICLESFEPESPDEKIKICSLKPCCHRFCYECVETLVEKFAFGARKNI